MKATEIKNLVTLLTLTDSKGASFLGIREYQSNAKLKDGEKHEIANHTVISNFSYSNAVEHDIKALEALTNKDIEILSKNKGFTVELLEQAKNNLLTSFVKNQSKETQSNQSKVQQDIYINISDAIKLHKETEKVYIYALAHKKTVLVEGKKFPTNSRELTKAQNVIKKYCEFKTIKFRMFVVNPEQLASVKAKGKEVEII